MDKNPIRIKQMLSAATLLVLMFFTSAKVSSASPLPQAQFHTVQANEYWGSIAAAYGVPVELLWQANGVTNPTLLREGQRLFIPKTGYRPGESILVFDIAPNGSIWQAALQSGNMLSSLLLLNGLDSPAQAIGQQIYALNKQGSVAQIPSQPTPRPAPTAKATVPEPATSEPDATQPVVIEGALRRSRMGIQGHFSVPEGDLSKLLKLAKKAGFTWVKYQVDWSRTEYLPGRYSVELDQLDSFMQEATVRDYNVLLSIVKAPDWARNTTEEDGPPADYNAYNEFVKMIVLRYKYQIAAIEIWNEPNLRREWNGATLSGYEYVRLLAGAYGIIKSVYPEGDITVVSAGLAPTGINDGVSAVDDRRYLHQMYEAGLPNYADAVGIHPYSWANPPWLHCCNDPTGPPTHNNHPSFFFLDTIEDYRAIQATFGDSDRQLWATEFGWGTMDGLGLPIPEDAPFFAYVNQEQQAQYILEAFLMTQEWDYMGPMFLWNLNVAALDEFDHNQAGYSIILDIKQPRPAYTLLLETPKIEDHKDEK
jgi:LysM repeat protein